MTSAQVVETSGQCHHKQSFSALHSTRKIKICGLIIVLLGSNSRFLGSTLIELKFALKKTRQVFNLWPPKASWRKFGRTCKAALKWLFCCLSLTCVYAQVRLATHPYSMFGSLHFLTCVDLQLRLTRALECAYFHGLEVNVWGKLFLLRYGMYFFVNCTEPSTEHCTEANAQLIST